jgi:negative regulator of sigma E activity
MVTLIGVILVVVGLSDFGAAAVIQMQQRQSDPSGLGQEQQTPVVRLLRMIGLATVVIGAVLIAVGLAS